MWSGEDPGGYAEDFSSRLLKSYDHFLHPIVHTYLTRSGVHLTDVCLTGVRFIVVEGRECGI